MESDKDFEHCSYEYSVNQQKYLLVMTNIVMENRPFRGDLPIQIVIIHIDVELTAGALVDWEL